MTTTTTTVLDETAAVALAAHRQRYTSGRRTLLATLAALDAPVTIPQILRASPELAQSSVYRNLAQLVTAGIVREIPSAVAAVAGGHAHFELTERAGGSAHQVYECCTGCGRVTRAVPPAMLAWSKAVNLLTTGCSRVVTAVAVTLAVTCDPCTEAVRA